jgi:type IV pilus assembly protein PilC
MAQFMYTAFDKAKNRKITGQMEATSSNKVRSELEEKGLYVMKIEEQAARRWFLRLPSFRSVSRKDLASFYRSLMLSVRAGVSLGQVFECLIEQFTSRYFRQVLSDVHAGITKGRALSECFAGYPNLFPEQFVNMVLAGEASGKLAEVLEDYVKYEDEARKLRGDIIGAMMYPCVILVAAGIATAILVLYIFPTFIKALGLPMDRMPWITQAVYYTSTSFLAYWPWIIFGGGITMIMSFYFFFKVRLGIRMKDWLQVNFPVVRELFVKINLSRFARTMALQSRSGVASVQALQLTEKSLGNVYYREMVADVVETIKRGGTYVEALKRRPRLITPLVVLLISVGEQTGTFDEVLDTIADFYSDEVRVTVKSLTSLIEPLAIVVVGLVVAVIVASMFLPLFDMVNNIS